MIVAATNYQSGWSGHLPFNWFDVALVVVLAFGLFRGRKNGMSKEILPFSQWVAVVVVAGFSYPLVTNMLVNLAGMRKSAGTCILAYVIMVVVVLFIFSMIKNSLKPKLGGSSFFGNSEYYLGMLSGIIRYACVVIFFLALLNAPVYTAAEIQAQEDYNNRWYGGGLEGYAGDYIPSVPTIQESVFKKSLLGPFIHKYLALVLINSDATSGVQIQSKTPIIHMGN